MIPLYRVMGCVGIVTILIKDGINFPSFLFVFLLVLSIGRNNTSLNPAESPPTAPITFYLIFDH